MLNVGLAAITTRTRMPSTSRMEGTTRATNRANRANTMMTSTMIRVARLLVSTATWAMGELFPSVCSCSARSFVAGAANAATNPRRILKPLAISP
jgi:hypothetical protein